MKMGPCRQGRNKTQKVKKRKKAAELWKEPREEQGLTLMVRHTEATVCLPTSTKLKGGTWTPISTLWHQRSEKPPGWWQGGQMRTQNR